MVRICYLALNTFRESVRSKVIYSLFFFAAVLVLVSALFGAVTIGDQVKVIKDFGLFSVSFFAVAYAVISGAALLHKELARKTIYNILAKPVRRWEFLCGKYFGMLATIALMILLMSVGLFLFTFLFDGHWDFHLLKACLYIFFQLIIVCALAIFFSSIVVTPMLSGAFTFGVFLAGRSGEYLLYFIKEDLVEGLLAGILEGLFLILPNLSELDISNQAVYGQSPGWEHFIWALLYSSGYAGILLILATFIFRNREFR